MNNLNWGTSRAYLIDEVNCGNLSVIGNGTYSYEITNQALFDKSREQFTADNFTKNQVLYALSDIILEEETIDAANLNNVFTSERFLQEANENVSGFGFKFTNITVKSISLDNESKNLYDVCVNNLSNNNITTEEKVEQSEDTGKELGSFVAESWYFLVGFSVTIAVIILGYRFIRKRRKSY